MNLRRLRLGTLSLLCLILGQALMLAAPAVTVPPISCTVVNQGGVFNLSVTATGTGPLSYQWYHDNRPLAGATSASYSDASASYSDRGAYTVKITDGSNEVTRVTGFVNVLIPGASVVAWGANWSGESSVPGGLSGIVAIAAGNSHTVALKADGTVSAWGANWSGETNVPEGLTQVVAIAASGSHTVALKADGTVVSWGTNWYGELNVPAGLADVIAVAAGSNSTFAVKADGTVVAWGSNWFSETTIPSDLADVTAVTAGTNHTVTLKTDGTLIAWGANWAGQTTLPVDLNNVVAIAAFNSRTMALKADGTVVAWGNNGSGETTIPDGLNDVTAIAAGGNHSVALKSNGTVVAWGSNWNGETTVPSGLGGVAAIAAGYSHTVALFTGIPPAINLGPQSTTVAIGQPVSLMVTASGSLLAYQWYRNGVAIPGQTGPSLSADAVSFYDAGTYTVTVSSPLGTLTSAAVGVTVTLPSSLANATEAYPLIKGYAFDPAKTLLDAYITAHPAAADVPLARLLRSAARLGIAAANDSTAFMKTTLGASRASLEDMVALGTSPVSFPTAYSVQPGEWIQNGNSWRISATDMSLGMGMQPPQSIVFNNRSATNASITLQLDQPDGTLASFFFGNIEFTDKKQAGLQLANIVDAQGRATITLPANTGTALVIGYTGSPLRVSVVGSLPADVQVLAGSEAIDYTDLKAGSNLTDIFNFLKVQDAAVLTPLLEDLAAIPADAEIRLAAAQIGSMADIVLAQPDRAMIQAGVKFTQALRLLGETFDLGADLSNGDIFQTATWDDFLTSHPQFMTALANSSPAVRSQAKALIQQAVAHYRGVETDLWSRPAPAGGGSYLVSIDPAMADRIQAKADVSTSLTKLLAALDGVTNIDNLVALSGVSGFSIGTQLNLAPLFAAQPYDLRAHLPATEAGIISAGRRVLNELLITTFVPPVARTVVNAGSGFTLSVSATGVAPLSYQWYHDNRPIAGAIGASYGKANVAYTDRGAYTVKVTDGTTVTRATGFVLVQIPSAAVLAWGGMPSYGQTASPVGLTDVVAIAAGGNHTMALKADGTVVTWGWNMTPGDLAPTPAGLTDVVAIATGNKRMMALKADGTVVVWGQIALPYYYYQFNATTDSAPAGLTDVVAIATQEEHMMALKSDGTVTAWGNDMYSQTNAVPVGLTDVVAVAAASSYSTALKADGTVVTWGDAIMTTPAGLTHVAAIAAGGNRTLALKTDGTLVDWNYMNLIPADLTHVTAIAAGFNHAIALTVQGTAVELGNYTNTASPEGLSNVIAIAAGDSHSVALFSASTPTIFSPSNTAAVPIGQSFTLAAPAPIGQSYTGTIPAMNQPVSYQWYYNGAAILGETGAYFDASEAHIYNTGTYQVDVTTAVGTVSSAPVAITVTLLSSLSSAAEAYALLQGYAFEQAKTLLDTYLAAQPTAADVPLARVLRSAARLGVATMTDAPVFLKTKLGATRAEPADWAVLGTNPVKFFSAYAANSSDWTQNGNSWQLSTSGYQNGRCIVFNNSSDNDTTVTLQFDQPNFFAVPFAIGRVEYSDERDYADLQINIQAFATIPLPAHTGTALTLWYTGSPLRISVLGSLPAGIQAHAGAEAQDYSVLKSGSKLTDVFDFLKVQDTAVLMPLLADLAAIPADAVVRLAAAQIGSTADIVLAQPDRAMIQAAVKFTQALRLLGETYDRDADLSNGDIFQTASWDDFLTSHPLFLTALANSSPAVRSQAKALIQQAVAHYRDVEAVLWSRPAPAGGGSYLVSIDPASPTLAADKANISMTLVRLLAALDGATNVDDLVALRGMTGVPLGTQVNLSSLFATQAYDIRAHLPATEAAIRSGGIALLDGLLISSFAQTIDFTGPSDCRFSHEAIPLTATAGSGLDVSYQVVAGQATVGSSAVTLTGTGTVQVRASQAGNTVYAAAPDVNVSFFVAKVPLAIIADAKTKWAGAALPGLSVAYSGFVTGDTPAVLTGAPSLTTSATAGSLPGAYPITVGVGTLGAANYTFEFYNNILTVNAFSMADWRGLQFSTSQLANSGISGPNADPDGDGLPNQLEYAFGESPTQSTVNAAPVLSIQAGALALTYTRRNDVSDLTYTVEVSADLKTWASGDAYTQQIGVTPLDGLRDRVTVGDKTLLAPGVRRFMRVRVLQADVSNNTGVPPMQPGLPPSSGIDLGPIVAPSS